MSAAHAQIGVWLGVHPAATETDLLSIVENRFAPGVINRLLALGFDRSEIDEVVIPSRTLQHRRSRRGESFSVDESDRVLRIARAALAAELHTAAGRGHSLGCAGRSLGLATALLFPF